MALVRATNSSVCKGQREESTMHTRLLSSSFLPYRLKLAVRCPAVHRSPFPSCSSRAFSTLLLPSRHPCPFPRPASFPPAAASTTSPSHLHRVFHCRFSSFSDDDDGELDIDTAAGFGRGGGALPSMRRKSATTTKTRTFYVCENCGESYGQWWGKCNSCKKTGSLRKFTQRPVVEGGGGGAGVRAAEGVGHSMEGLRSNEHTSARASDAPLRSWLKRGVMQGPQRLSDVSRGINESNWRLPLLGATGMEIARVLGGGLVPGSLILVGGDPGVGKSTLLLQVCSILAGGCEFYEPAPVLYVSGEESEQQISNRADRLQVTAHELFLFSATDLEVILEVISQLRPRAVVIDSIQTVYLPEAAGSSGSVVQVRECAAALLRLAKRTQIPIFLVGHVTRSGDIAGPRVLEHIVDVVLYLEGENRLSHRILRVVKNRFGSSDEVGVFEMAESGLEAVENPSQLFLSQREEETSALVSGAIAVTLEGSRPFLVEIQALCSASSQACRVTVNGVDPQRLNLILAVLNKMAGVKLANQNVLISVVGGLQVREPAVDLAVAVALCSSYFERQIPSNMAFVGEIGLGGELRPVKQLEKRVYEVSKLGFDKCVVPKMSEKALRACQTDLVTLIPCATLQEVIQRVILSTFITPNGSFSDKL